MRTDEPRQGRNAATVVCSAFAVVPLAFLFFGFVCGDAAGGVETSLVACWGLTR